MLVAIANACYQAVNVVCERAYIRHGRRIPGEGLGVGGESGCVPAVVTGELTAQVAGWVCEGSQELRMHSSGYSGSAILIRYSPMQWATDIPKDKKQILCR